MIKTSILLSKENEGFYLECKTKNGPTIGYGLMPKQNLVRLQAHGTKTIRVLYIKILLIHYVMLQKLFQTLVVMKTNVGKDQWEVVISIVL